MKVKLLDQLEDLITDLTVYSDGLSILRARLSPSVAEDTLNLMSQMSQLRHDLDDYLETLSKLYPELFLS